MKIIQPNTALRPYVRYYWILESNNPFKVLTYPIGCPQFIFHRKTPIYIPETDSSQSSFTISGQVNFPAHLESSGNLEMLVAVFYPHTIGMFIDTPPSAFYNSEISGFDLERKRLNDLARRILECDDANKGIEILETWLLAKINPSRNLERINAILPTLLVDPSIPITSLAESACLGKKQFERVFSATVGMNPKEYQRIVRFQKALFLMQNGDRNQAGVAIGCGYSDQSHYIREFKKLSGLSPMTLLNNTDPYSDLFTNPCR